jgi:hypothetical protein
MLSGFAAVHGVFAALAAALIWFRLGNGRRFGR